jgi:hypothetical protein
VGKGKYGFVLIQFLTFLRFKEEIMAELNISLTLIIVLIVFTSDYYLTIYGNRLYSKFGEQHFQYETSYELNPIFIHDVDNNRLLSPTFIRNIIYVLLYFWFWWYFTIKLYNWPNVFDFVAGIFLLLELPILLRHFRNIVAYNPKNIIFVQGRIEYSDKYSLSLTAQDYIGYAIVFFLVLLLTGKMFFFGGLFICTWMCFMKIKQIRKLV